MKTINIHLISDSTGETLLLMSKALLSQFDGLQVKEYTWSMTRSEAQLDRVIESVKQKNGVVLYTLAEEGLKTRLMQFCKENKIFCVEALEHLTKTFSEYLGKKPNPAIGKQHAIDQSYFQRIEAMNFTISHDDGQISEQIENAEIVLLGPSRTSKSPTSMYLAFRGFKTANIPIIKEVGIDESFLKNKEIFFIGLTISPKRLVEIRKNRLLSLNEKRETQYTDLDSVKEEVVFAKKICLKHNISLIDVTRRSVEETSAQIIQMYYERKKKK
ncbi:MAG: pyruvate, water dikinase regulatory protein [Rickettsiales bacterium]